MDPYVCFRRREARQTRKTRARDALTADKLKQLRRQLEEGRYLVVVSRERELLKRELLKFEHNVYKQRERVKGMKIRLGIKGEDEDLIHQKVSRIPNMTTGSFPFRGLTVLQPQKRKAADVPTIQKPPGTLGRLPPRADTRVAEPDLVLLEDKLAEKENELRMDLENKVLYHRKWNQDYVDLTQGPLSPVHDQRMEDMRFRPARTQYLMTPPASSASDSMDVDEEPMSPVADKRPALFQFMAGGGGKGGGGKEIPEYPRQPAFRRRIGRMGRLWIDRRGLGVTPGGVDDSSDQWKYDSDEEDETTPVYEVDPFNTTALRFRSTIPLPNFMWKRPKEPPAIESGSSPHGHNPQGMTQPLASQKQQQQQLAAQQNAQQNVQQNVQPARAGS